jgi:hypothetical protein
VILSPDLVCKVWRAEDASLRLRVAGKARAGLVAAGADDAALRGDGPLPRPEAIADKLPTLVRGEDLRITLPRADVAAAAGAPPAPPRPAREVKPDEVVDWLELAKRIEQAVDGQYYAGEIVEQVLRPSGMVKNRHPEVTSWARQRDREDKAPEGGA